MVPDPALDLTLVSQSKTQVTFSWTVPNGDGGSPIRDYEVFGDEGNAGLANDNFVQLSETTFLTLQHTETDLTPGTMYRFYVRARNDAGLGDASELITI